MTAKNVTPAQELSLGRLMESAGELTPVLKDRARLTEEIRRVPAESVRDMLKWGCT